MPTVPPLVYANSGTFYHTRLGGVYDTQQLYIGELFNHSNLQVINHPLQIDGTMNIANPELVLHIRA